MIILAIDTSCDDTCVSILKIRTLPSARTLNALPILENFKLKILSNIVSSQVKLHAKYGGVFPILAKREHQKNLPIVFKKAIKEAKNPKIDFIAVTAGPGLEPCLWEGINFAENLAEKLKLPIIPVDHVEAHIMANFVGNVKGYPTGSRGQQNSNIKTFFPAICLVVSGGHTQLILMKNFGQYKILGETRDDAAGECFDKVARILGLGYPGGPIVAATAAKFQISNMTLRGAAGSKFKIRLPRPMINQKNYDFSFSGLKTAVLYDWQNRKQKVKKAKEYIREMAAEVQQAVIDVLISKTLRAAKEVRAKSLILGGGVASNNELRKQFKEEIKKEIPNTKYLIPDTKYCTDNAVMIAVAGYYHSLGRKYKRRKPIEANANLRLE